MRFLLDLFRNLLVFSAVSVSADCTIPEKWMPKEGPGLIILPSKKLDVVADAIFGVDYFRGFPGTNPEASAGAFLGLNMIVSIPNDLRYSFGLQLGGSYGLYNWPVTNYDWNRRTQEQSFLTGGFFLNTDNDVGFNLAIVYDWMYGSHFGAHHRHANLTQVRYLASYLACCSDEIGVWGTVHTNTSHKKCASFRAVDQVSLFWRHLFVNCCEAKVWAGFPYGNDHHFTRRGKYLVGGNFFVPLPCNWSVEGRGMYMQSYQCDHGNDYAFDLCLGINYSFGCKCCCPKDSCTYRTYLPIGNNSNFVVNPTLINKRRKTR